jgi:hypothetical protein
MQLILAIVADQQQAAQLAALIDGRLPVDLVQAAEVGEGLLALDDRIPDLILTSPLMSPFDDGVLDEYLRDLGPAGAHVQTLRIPVLSQAPKKAPRLGFSLRRRAKPEATTPDGCDPKVFADEIALYLTRAAEEKLHASTNESAPVIERRALQEEMTAQPVDEVQWRPAYGSDADDDTTAWTAPEPEPDASAWRSDLLDRPAADETYDAPAPAAVDDLETPIYEPVALSRSVEVEPFEEPVAEQVLIDAVEESPVVAQVHVEEIEERPVQSVEEPRVAAVAELVVAEAAPVEPSVVETPVAEPAVIARPAPAHIPARVAVEGDSDSHKATPSFKAALAAIRAAWGKPNSKESPSTPVQEEVAPVSKERAVATPEVTTSLEVDLTGAVDQLDEPAPALVLEDSSAASVQRPFVPADSPDAPDVYELSVEPDMNELEPAPSPQESSGDRRKKPAKRANKAVKAKGPRPAQPKSAQDEWGVFDPNRCGFAALVDKLDEEVSDEKDKQPRNSVKSRVLSCS